MEKKSPLVPFLMAAGAAVFYLATLTARERAVTENYEKGRVLVARVDLPERTVLKEEHVETLEIPRLFMAQDAFEVKTPGDMRLIANLVTRVRIPRGNQISQSSLVSLSPEAGLAAKVPPGYRGTTLPIDAEMRALLKPGDRVDVLVTFDALMASGRKEKMTATVLQNVLVVAVGNDMGQGMTAKQYAGSAAAEERLAAMSEKSAVSLAVNPRELQYLALAHEQGHTKVAVRASGDNQMHPIDTASWGALFGGPQP